MALLYPKLRQRPEHFRINRRHPLAEGLVFAGLAGDGCVGSVAYRDASGYGNHGTLTNMDPATDWVWVPELGRWGLDFPDTNASCVTLTNATALNFIAQDFSVAGWLYSYGVGSIDGIIGNDFGLGKGWWVSLYQVTNQISLWVGGAASLSYVAQGATAIQNNQWYHFAATFHNATKTGTIYLNGVQDGQKALANAVASGTSTIRIGEDGRDGTGYPWNGLLCDLVAWRDRILSPAEIAALADPSNAMLSGLILPPRRRLWPVAAASPTNPVAVTETTLYNTEPFAQDEVIGTAQATGGTGTYTWEIVSQTLL